MNKMRRPQIMTSVVALGLSLSAPLLAQGAKPAPPAAAPPAAAPPAAAPPAAAPPAAAPPAAPEVPAAPPVAAPPPPEPEPALTLPPTVGSEQAPLPSADPEPDLPPPDLYQGGDAWYDLLAFSAFVDSFVSVNYKLPKPQAGKNALRAHDQANGFSLAWVGFDASYPAGPVGGTVSLRFGPSAQQIGRGCLSESSANCDDAYGLSNVKQAFASWRPGGSDSAIRLDLGKFDTPFGAEVAESHLNMNYTRSMLYASQPVTHTGLRVDFAVAPTFDFRLLAVNGWNNSVDNNVGKSLGAQATFHVGDALTASLGYMGGPERDDTELVVCETGSRFVASAESRCVASGVPVAPEDQSGLVDGASANTKGLRHLIDLVVTARPLERLSLVLNADLGFENTRSATEPGRFDASKYYGVLLGARLGLVDELAVAVRGEFFHDGNGFISLEPGEEMNLLGGTVTLELLPADFLTVRLDNRVDWSSKRIFDQGIRDKGGYQLTTTLGVVAHTN